MKKILVCAEDSLSIIRIERLLLTKNRPYDIQKSPIKKDELLLSDGGILNNFPTNLIKEKCDKLIGVYVAPLQDVKNNQLTTIKAVATRAYELLSHSVENYKFKYCDWLISPKELSNYGMFESKKTRMEELFQLGFSEAEKTFPKDF